MALSEYTRGAKPGGGEDTTEEKLLTHLRYPSLLISIKNYCLNLPPGTTAWSSYLLQKSLFLVGHYILHRPMFIHTVDIHQAMVWFNNACFKCLF